MTFTVRVVTHDDDNNDIPRQGVKVVAEIYPYAPLGVVPDALRDSTFEEGETDEDGEVDFSYETDVGWPHDVDIYIGPGSSERYEVSDGETITITYEYD